MHGPIFGVGNILYICHRCGARYYDYKESSPGTAFRPEKRTWHNHGCGTVRKVVEFFNPTSYGFFWGLFNW